MTLVFWIGALVFAIIAFVIGWFLNQSIGAASLSKAKKQSEIVLNDAQNEGENIKKEKLLEAEDEIFQLRQKLEDEFHEKTEKLNAFEHDLNDRDSNLDRKADLVEKKEVELLNVEKDLRTLENQNKLKQENLNHLISQQNELLEKISGLSTEEAKSILMNNLFEEAKEKASKTIYSITEEAKKEAQKKAQNVIITAIQQSGVDYAIESTVSVVLLPNDEMKGRIIGREGRNIRAFEITTGVDVIVDDTPGSIILSAFDPMRREIARIVMEKLVADGRIHPGRIEDMYEKTKQEMDDYIRELGEQALLESGVHGLHSDLVYLLGKLRFRTTYGQNVLQHVKEVSMIAGIIAAELGIDVNMAKRAGLLHDIGRAIERNTQTNHYQLGFEICKKYNEHPNVLNAIQGHHGDVEPISPLAVIVQVANDISSTRPGARREVIENFVKRMKKLEAIAESFEGVRHSFAIQAGKEIRIMAAHDQIDDFKLQDLADNIAQKIQDEIDYPGQVKVVVIREFRGMDLA